MPLGQSGKEHDTRSSPSQVRDRESPEEIYRMPCPLHEGHRAFAQETRPLRHRRGEQVHRDGLAPAGQNRSPCEPDSFGRRAGLQNKKRRPNGAKLMLPTPKNKGTLQDGKRAPVAHPLLQPYPRLIKPFFFGAGAGLV